MFNRLKNSFYSRLMLSCIGLLCLLLLLLLPICLKLLDQHAQDDFLKRYDQTLSSLSDSLAARQNGFAASLSPLFDNEAETEALVALYRNHSRQVPVDRNTELVNLLSRLCGMDSYNCGALLLTRTGHLYQYDTRYEVLTPLDLRGVQRSLTPYQLQLYPESELSALSSEFQKPVSHLYGMGASVFDPDSAAYLGTLILLYSTSEFSDLIESGVPDNAGVFAIADSRGLPLFSSDGDYSALPEPGLSGGVNALTGHRADSNDNIWLRTSVFQPQSGLYLSYRIPRSAIGAGSARFILIALSSVIVAFAVLTFAAAIFAVQRKTTAIREGMKRFGENNLSFRLPIPKTNDEFTQIIKGFNSMGAALQRNVEKAYLYEINQRRAELYAMQTSINPHFLYNALEQIRVLLQKGNEADASQMLLLLSRMYRSQTRRSLYISIAEEAGFGENLINFYLCRYGSFEYACDIDSSVRIYMIPKNTLQPLIENYFVHGYNAEQEDSFLSISAVPFQRDGRRWIRFTVENNGTPITDSALQELKQKLREPIFDRTENNGFALSNVNLRLKLVFGEQSGLVPFRGEGFGLRFEIPALLPEEIGAALDGAPDGKL